MKRENLNSQLESIKTKISELEKKRFKYFIHGKYINGFGPLQTLDDPSELTKAFRFVKDQFTTDENLDSIEAELGFSIANIDQEEQTYLGFELPEWTEEFKMKAAEIQNASAIERLKTALKTFKGYRTEDEKFESDAKKFGSLFDELGLNVDTVKEPVKTDEFLLGI